jgi:alanine dehydrogenase
MAVNGRAVPLASPMASIGVPTEIKRDERRVALTPDGANELVSPGLAVRVPPGWWIGRRPGPPIWW